MTPTVACGLSGGGAKGAFELGVLDTLRTAYDVTPDVVSGVSVGALNGLLLAQDQLDLLRDIWFSIDDDQVYRKGFLPIQLLKLLFWGKLGLYDHTPLRATIYDVADPEKITIPIHAGFVSLTDGQYYRPELTPIHSRDCVTDAVWASATMPLIWDPVDCTSRLYTDVVDGGIRNVQPVGDLMQYAPDEIYIINCQGRHLAPARPTNILQNASRVIDVMISEIIRGDYAETVRVNEYLKQIQDRGGDPLQHHSGRTLKHVDIHLIEPTVNMGGTLDFSRDAISKRYEHGVRRTQEVLG